MVISVETRERVQRHVRELTVAIGERSVFLPANLKRSESYIESIFRGMGLPVTLDTYEYQDFTVANVIATLDFGDHPSRFLVVGAHYDSVVGTVGADDNASAVAVLLETARCLAAQRGEVPLDLRVTFVAFALEEPPVFATRYMGSRVYAKRAKKTGERIDAMICLEMVGYTCHQPGCQRYPLPLMFRKYPREGNFIGVVGNSASRGLTRSVTQAFGRNPELPVVTLTVPFSGWLLPSVRLSDHSPFWDQGYQAVMVTDTAFLRNPYYHSMADTMDKLNFDFMAELVESLVIFLVDQGKG
ncbi:MAG TPA: peptidase M28 [Syntrophobacteraceae bacterium]|nr:peptidase M28 [Syntrophobacteraceae bacterium]